MKDKELSFEEALRRLEAIAAEMEKENSTLDSSLAHYEEGMKLMQICHKKLDEAKKKIDVLVKKSADQFDVQPFDASVLTE